MTLCPRRSKIGVREHASRGSGVTIRPRNAADLVPVANLRYMVSPSGPCRRTPKGRVTVNRLIEFKLDDQTTVLVEADDSIPAAGQARVSTGGILTEKASKAFDAALAGIRPIASSVMQQVV